MKKRLHSFTSAVLIFAALFAACSPTVATAPSGQVQTVVAVTFSAMTVAAVTVPPPVTELIATLSPIAVTESFSQYFVQTTAQNVNLRVGPGTLFKVSRVLAQGTSLEVIGRARGGQWFQVKNDEGIIGWVLVELVKGGYDGPPPPFADPADAFLVTGTVKTDLGTPVTGIGFAFEQGANRADAATDSEGRFYAYLPNTLSGTWRVSFVSIACTSNTMDSNCNCKSGTCASAHPNSVDITLPVSGDLVFTWK